VGRCVSFPLERTAKPFRLEKSGRNMANGEGDDGWRVRGARWRSASQRQIIGARRANAAMIVM